MRLLDAGKEKQLEEILRIVSGQLLELGMNNAAAVTAAAVMGVEANAACPGDIAYRLLTRLLLVGKKSSTFIPCRAVSVNLPNIIVVL